jgi:uncharacterized protein YidB (DUF937 family)
MSNQRAGKYHRASGMDSGSEMKIYQFFKQAQEALESAGEDDAAFYFEQVTTWIKEGKSLPSESKQIARVLGL